MKWAPSYVLLLLAFPTEAKGEASPSAQSAEASAAEDDAALLRAARAPIGGTTHVRASLGVGKGLRFNNPFRLSSQLGDDASSLSLTATYLDLGLGLTYGAADGVQHGAILHLVTSLQGVPQSFFVPAYLATWRAAPRWALQAHAGPNVLLSPETNVGAELGAGAVFFGTAGLGVSAEALLDTYFGAATLDVTSAVHPVLSFQLSLVLDLEVLP